MTKPTKFPKELLLAPARERIEYFSKKAIKHTTLTKAHDDLLSKIHNSVHPIIFVMGPTGVGKKTLKELIIRDLESSPQEHPGSLPVISLTAPAQSWGNFRWKDFYKEILQRGRDILVDSKLDRTEAGYQKAVTNMLYYRHPYALIIDEAHHLSHLSNPKTLAKQLNTLKSLVEGSPMKIVLLGTYELISYSQAKGEIIRRSDLVHFPRYRYSKLDDMKAFQSALWSMQRHLPVEKEPDLLRDWSSFYERSLGCIGILKLWLVNALTSFMNDRTTTSKMDYDFCRNFAFSAGRLTKILQEAILYEETVDKMLDESDEGADFEALRKSLYSKADSDESGDFSDKTEDEQRIKGHHRRAVGERNPTRDPVDTRKGDLGGHDVGTRK